MLKKFLAVTLAALLVVLPLAPKSSMMNIASASTAASVKSEVVYQIIVDRFFDGDTTNNNPAISSGMFDSTKTNWKAYWGGDLEGIRQKISYLKGMGITTLYISPVMDNVNKNHTTTSIDAPYHGYSTRDFKAIEEHFGTWAKFDQVINELHANGMKAIIDFVPNHSNFADAAEFGKLYNNGVLLCDALNDVNVGCYHKNGTIINWDDRFQAMYKDFFSLADISQENEMMANYLIDSAKNLLAHGVDGFRFDAIKHMNPGFQKVLADKLYQVKDIFLTGEWYGDMPGSSAHNEKVRFTNNTGINILDFDTNDSIRSVFGYKSQNMYHLRDRMDYTNSVYKFKENLFTFVDNHDMPRFLNTAGNFQPNLHQALGYILMSRGTPVIYYGTEQYLKGGADPYNREMMPGFSTTTIAYKEIAALAAVRKNNAAVAYGTTTTRWINNDVIIFERKFFNNVVLVAVNRGAAQSISGLLTSLPNGTYADAMTGLVGGGSISVSAGAVGTFTLGAGAVAVYQSNPAATSAQVGSVAPNMGIAGNTITINGQGFGTTKGTVKFGSTLATVKTWTDKMIEVVVPVVGSGISGVTVIKSGSTVASNSYDFNVLSGKQTAVVFTVNNVPPTNFGDKLYIVGDKPELGNWSTAFGTGINQSPIEFICPNYPNWFHVVSVPAGQQIQFKFVIKKANGSVIWESGSNHIVTTPTTTTGNITVNWKYY